MSDLRIQAVDGEAMLEDWRHVHNVIIPADPLSQDEVRERAGRNRLAVAYLLPGAAVAYVTLRLRGSAD